MVCDLHHRRKDRLHSWRKAKHRRVRTISCVPCARAWKSGRARAIRACGNPACGSVLMSKLVGHMHTRTAFKSVVAAGAAVVCFLVLGAAARAADCTSLSITNQPRNRAEVANCSATFAVGVAGTEPHFHQWFRNGEIIPGATNSSYTTPILPLSENGALFSVLITNACSQATSAIAVLSVLADIVSLHLRSARGDATLERVVVSFMVFNCDSQGLFAPSAEDVSNYSLTGEIIASHAQLDTTGTNVILSTSRQSPGAVYTLTVNGVMDSTGNEVPRDSHVQFQAWVIRSGSDPPEAVPPPVNITRTGSNVLIFWPPGSTLQEADGVVGPWRDLDGGAPNPFPITVTNAARFYRALF